jgi:Kdo2-lipid IVA lauroyltransferase/acyltransferase
MLGPVLYYLFIYPVSRLPFPVLYIFSDVFFVLVYYVAPYRKKVVMQNLRRSFPQKNSAEIKSIAKEFYHHFCDITLESFKMFNITEAELRARFVFNDMSLMQRLYAEGKSVVFAGGHYNNWEVFAVACHMGIPHKCLALYKPLTNKWFDKKMQQSRGRFGLHMWPIQQSKEMFEAEKANTTISIFGMDQSPSSGKRCHWMRFLNQDTGVSFGTEKFARDYNMPVVFGRINKIKRGHYSLDVQLLTDEPAAMAKGEIMERLMRLLETDINHQPQYWLWTHRRWKRKKPDGVVIAT